MVEPIDTGRSARASWIAAIGFIAAAIALTMVAASGPAYRVKLFGLREAFALLRWGAWAGLGAAAVAFVGAWMSRRAMWQRSFALAAMGVVIGAIAFAVPFAMLQSAKKWPPIHDITTDTQDPPRFVA